MRKLDSNVLSGIVTVYQAGTPGAWVLSRFEDRGQPPFLNELDPGNVGPVGMFGPSAASDAAVTGCARGRERRRRRRPSARCTRRQVGSRRPATGLGGPAAFAVVAADASGRHRRGRGRSGGTDRRGGTHRTPAAAAAVTARAPPLSRDTTVRQTSAPESRTLHRCDDIVVGHCTVMEGRDERTSRTRARYHTMIMLYTVARRERDVSSRLFSAAPRETSPRPRNAQPLHDRWRRARSRSTRFIPLLLPLLLYS